MAVVKRSPMLVKVTRHNGNYTVSFQSAHYGEIGLVGPGDHYTTPACEEEFSRETSIKLDADGSKMFRLVPIAQRKKAVKK